MPNIPSFEREWGEPRAIDDVPEPIEDEDALARRQASRIPDRRHILRAGQYSTLTRCIRVAVTQCCHYILTK